MSLILEDIFLICLKIVFLILSRSFSSRPVSLSHFKIFLSEVMYLCNTWDIFLTSIVSFYSDTELSSDFEIMGSIFLCGLICKDQGHWALSRVYHCLSCGLCSTIKLKLEVKVTVK